MAGEFAPTIRPRRPAPATLAVAGAAAVTTTVLLLRPAARPPFPVAPVPAAAAALTVEAVAARTEAVRDEAVLSGQIEAHDAATLSAEVADVVTARPVQKGDAVAKGQVIATLDERTARAALDRAEAALDQTAAAREQAGADYRRSAIETAAAQEQARAGLAEAAANDAKARAYTRRQELRQAEASLAQAGTDERLARLQADRYQSLLTEGAVPQEQYDERKTALDDAIARRESAAEAVSLAREGARREDVAAAAAQVAGARAAVVSADARPERLASLRAQVAAARAQEAGAAAAVRDARIDLNKHTIRAPFAGRVLATRIDVGERAAPGVPVADIGRLDPVKVTFAAPEAMRPGLRLGQTVRATTDALPGRAFAGRITALGAQADDRTRAFPVEVTVANPDGALLPNMVARVRLASGASVRRVTVPVASVAAEAGGTYVYLLRGGAAVRRQVTLGAPVGGDRVTVRAGLSGGEAIATAPQRLTDGARVRVAR